MYKTLWIEWIKKLNDVSATQIGKVWNKPSCPHRNDDSEVSGGGWGEYRSRYHSVSYSISSLNLKRYIGRKKDGMVQS